MNHSICSADRATHLKIVVMALFLATVVLACLFLHSSFKGHGRREDDRAQSKSANDCE